MNNLKYIYIKMSGYRTNSHANAAPANHKGGRTRRRKSRGGRRRGTRRR